MSNDINKMDFKQLRNEVQLLRDELAKMQRKYEDLLYNLDDDNFSSQLLKEKNGMKAEISVTAEEIKTKVSKAEVESTISQTASAIRSEVKTADEKLSTQITQTASEIRSEVNDLDDALSTQITQTAGQITSRVEDLETFQSSTFIQNTDGFVLDGKKTAFTGVIFLTDNDGNNKASLFHDESQGYEQVILHSIAKNIPFVIGDYDSNVYIGQCKSGREVATRDWVLENGGGSGGTVTAVFA